MRLQNHTLKYLVLILPVVIAIWAGLFYYNMVDEIEDSLDMGLDHYKMMIIQQAGSDSTILANATFNERNYAIREIDRAGAMEITDTYRDTMMYLLSEEDYEPVRLLTTAFKQGERYFELRVTSSTFEKDELIGELLWALILLYAALLLSVLVINNLVLRKIWMPFYQILEKIGKFNLEKNPVITPTPGRVTEFRELDEQLVKLGSQSAAIYNSQKQFLENASHELQTPLAVAINRLELLAEQEELKETQLESIGQLIGQLQRMTRLNKALLLLTRIENRQFVTREKVHINQLVTELSEQLADLSAFRQVTLHIAEEGQLNWNVHPDLAGILVSNLLKNALVHNQSGGTVSVTLTDHALIVKNTAQGQALQADRIFQRFNKQSTDTRRIGLGLAIVKAICEVSDLQISYLFEDNLHQFRVQQR